MPMHGVTVDRDTGGVGPIETIEGAAIGIMASASELDEGELVLLRTDADLLAADDGTGTITAIMNAIRKHSQAPVVLNVVDDDTLEDAAGNAALYTLAYRFLQAEAELGVRPRILASALVAGANDDLIAVANRLYGIVYLDGTNTTDADAINDTDNYDAQRAAYCDPAFYDADDVEIGLSVLYAAIASTQNFWESASNKPVLGVKSLKRSVAFTNGDAECQAQLLNNAGVNTLIRQDGWRLWGGLSLSADTRFKFLCVSRTDDIIAESLQLGFLAHVDKGITKTFVADLVVAILSFLRGLKARGALIDGKAWADPKMNTAATISLGELYLDYDFTPVYPAHSITLRRHLTTEYLNQIVG